MDRKLAAIFAADVVGYSALMGADEAGTLERFKMVLREVVDPAITRFHGRVIKLMGDGVLAEFPSVVDAVQCAATIQRDLERREEAVAEASRIRFRIGVNLGDIIVEGDDLYGDGVNIAARLEAMAPPGGICVSGTAFDHAAHKAGVGFEALGERQLKNIADPVRVYRVLLDESRAGKIVGPARRALLPLGLAALSLAVVIAGAALWWLWHAPPSNGRPSIAVLPFANMTGDGQQAYFAEGMTEDLITDLAKLSGLTVISYNSVLGLKNKPVPVPEAARMLGVRYVIEGSLREAGERVRVNVQLSDSRGEGHLWADRFDRSGKEVFAVQEEIVQKVVESLKIPLSSSERERIARPPTANLEAYDYFLRGEQAARTGLSPELREALGHYAKAEELDPSFAEAFAADARTSAYVWLNVNDDVLPSPFARKRAYEKASRALELDPDLPLPYAVLALFQVIDKRYDDAIASARRAIALGPGNVESQVALAYVLMMAGEQVAAAAAIERALELNPHLAPFDRFVAGLVFFLKGDNDRAIAVLERGRSEAPQAGEFLVVLGAAYAKADRLDEAKAAVTEGLRSKTTLDSLAAYRLQFTHFRNTKDLKALLEALHKAGLPEWPFAFTAHERDRVKGDEISRLVLGHILKGTIEPGVPALMQIEADGSAGFRSPGRIIIGKVFITGDLMCEQNEFVFGRPDCGPVYRRSGNPAFTFVNTSKVFHFSPTP